MKTLAFAFCVFVGAAMPYTLAIAQESDAALASITYKFTHINDTTKPDQPHNEELILYVGQRGSLYKSYSAMQRTEQIRKVAQQAMRDDGISNIDFGGINMNPVTQSQYYLFLTEQKLYKTESLFRTKYRIDQDFPTLDWQIEDETKDIGGYSTQKAKATFKGRDYTAWFASDLPFPLGPWKLHGLPGLILEAEDSKNEVSFRFIAFEKLEGSDILIQLPSDVTLASQKAYDKALQAMNENPEAAIAAMMPGGVSPSVNSAEVRARVERIVPAGVRERAEAIQKRVTNNPLELTEK